jgi:hypothetical protein
MMVISGAIIVSMESVAENYATLMELTPFKPSS